MQKNTKQKNKKQKKTTIPDKDGHYDIDGVSYKNEHVYLGSDDIPEDKPSKKKPKNPA